MRDILNDVLKQASALFETIKVTGTEKGTRFQAASKDGGTLFDCHLNQPIPDLKGEFGFGNLGLLRGLLDFSSYRTDEAGFRIKRRSWKDTTTVEQFEFRDAKGRGADFRCMSPETVPMQAEVSLSNWSVTLTPDRSKLAEFQQLVTLYKEVDQNFNVKVEGDALVFAIGSDNASTHHASMVFAEGVTATLGAGLNFNSGQVLKLLATAGSEARLKISHRGLICVEFDTEHGSYKYYLRAVL